MNSPGSPKPHRSCDSCKFAQMHRREFMRLMGLSSLALLAARGTGWAQTAGDNTPSFATPEAGVDTAWLNSLSERGTPSVYTGDDLNYIGMPVGGILTGQLYLGGDGKLWQWDIFNILAGTPCDGDRYQHPPKPHDAMPVDQGFAISISSGGKDQTHLLDRSGFPDVRFRGEYPIGKVDYAGPGIPVTVSLEAFSPFIPLNADESGIPGTYLHYTVKNISDSAVDVTLTGWLQNQVGQQFEHASALRQNAIVAEKNQTFLNCSMQVPKIQSTQADVPFEDWHSPTYDGWTVTGTAFGQGPILRTALPAYIGDVGGDTQRVVNSNATAPGDNPKAKDCQTGKLTSRSFTIARNFLNFWLGGGHHDGRNCLNLLVDGKVVASATGLDRYVLIPRSIDMRPWMGKSATIEIVDAMDTQWVIMGSVGVGKISFGDLPIGDKVENRPDYGTMGLALFGQPAQIAFESVDKDSLANGPVKAAAASGDRPPIGALGRKFSLKPGESAEVVFAITWCFPNLTLLVLPDKGRYYSTKYDSALAVARHLGTDWTRLSSTTRLWRDTWYDSTLPYWFLDRTFLTVATLATSTPYRFSSGRFYSFEGVGSCDGTCTHVWHYAQAMARIFPELERDTRERVDLGISLMPESGVSGVRGEFNMILAVDGQAGTICRFYREHQMAPDNTFLKKNWAKMKLMFNPLFALDPDGNGILEGPQDNTLDATWFGKNSWESSLYVAALRAGAAMAQEMKDDDFASRCAKIADRGTDNITQQLFNGDYFINKVDPRHLDSINSGTGCEIDQVLGQSWAFQLGLPRVLPEKETRSALRALWKNNFITNIGKFRKTREPGRWYAQGDEAGLVMCTFPRADWDFAKATGGGGGPGGYFNECMTGFEYQAAGHMIAEGMVQEGLAVTRAIHDRYGPAKRNPWNEIECGDHYSRAMASYGVFINACGYESHGPKGHLGFSPKLTPENFRSPFTVAEGWGTFSQKIAGGRQDAEINLKWGQLKLNTFALTIAPRATVSAAKVLLDGKQVASGHVVADRRITISFATPLSLRKNQKLTVQIT